MKKYMNAGVALLLVGTVILSACKVEDGLPRGTYNVPVYVEQGGAKLVVETGGEIEVQSGATFDLQAGATTDFSSGIDLDGGALTLGTDGGVILDETSDDQVSMTLGAGTGDFKVLTGNFDVGNGSPTEAQDGEDTYLEGILEVDGATYFDGAVDMDSSLAIAGAVTLTQTNSAGAGANPFDYTATLGAMTTDDFTLFDVNITNADHSGSNTLQVLDVANITGDAETTEKAIVIGTGWDVALDANSGVTIDGGLTDIGTGTCGVADGDNDMCIAAVLEVDGELEADGAIDADSTSDFADTATFSKGSGNAIVVSSGGAIDANGNVDIAGTLTLTQVNAAGAAGNPFDYTGTLGAMTSDDFTLFDVNLTNADHTGSNTLQVLDIAAITGDAETTESAIVVGTGWDNALDVNGTQIILGADGGVLLDESSDDQLSVTLGAGTGDFNVLTGNLNVGNGTPGETQNGEDTYLESILEVDGLAYFDSAVDIDSGLAVAGAVTLTQTNAAAGSANPFDWTGTAGVMDGSDDLTIIDINLTNANHTTATNTIQALDIGNITGDAEATETAIVVGTGWDTGLDVNGTPITLGADGGVTLDEASDDALQLSLGAAAGTASILTGNFKVGNGSPTITQDGEDAYVEGNLETDGILLASFADETITDGEVLTPTKTTYALDSAGAVTMTLAATGQEGQILILIGDDANDILIADTNVRTSTGNALTLNQYDVVMWIYQDSEWIEVALLTDS